MGFPVKFASIATYILFAFFCSPCGSAQTVASRDPVNRKKSDVAPSIQALVGSAQALPIEYASDILFDVIQAGRIADPKWRLELLEDVFHRAPTAVNSYPQEDIGDPNDTVNDRQSAAYRLRLDSLSIQCRVVKMLAATSPRKAKELFNQIAPLHLTPRKCTEPMVYDVGIYFDTAHELFDNAFTPAERRHGEDLQLLTRVVGAVTSIEEAGHTAWLLSEMALPPADHAMVVSLYSGRLSEATGGDRDFSYVERTQELSKAIRKIAVLSQARSIPTDGLLRSYRGVMIRYLTGSRCSDSVSQPTGGTGLTEENTTVKFFNENLLPLSSDPSLHIRADAVIPERVLAAAKFVPLNFPKFNGLLHQLFLIRNHLKSDSGDWSKPVSEILAALESTDQAARPCDSCRFHEKSGVYIVLADLVPNGAVRDAVIDSYIDFLVRDRMQSDEPLEWLAQLKLVLQLTRSLSESDQEAVKALRVKGLFPTMLPGDHAKELLLKLQASKKALVSTYAYKEMLVPGKVAIPAPPK